MQFNKVHQSPCSVPPPDVIVVVVLGLRARKDSIKCCIGCLPERDPREREKEKRIFRIELKAPGALLV